MSQEKVDLKKEQKKNIKKTVRKKKVENTIATVCVTVVCLAIVGWIGFSIYTKASEYAEANKDYTYNEIDASALSDYLGSLNEE